MAAVMNNKSVDAHLTVPDSILKKNTTPLLNTMHE